jgi:hypothetical protein
LAVTVQLRQDLGAHARTAVQVVGVLRDEEPELAEPLEFDKGDVRRVRLDSVRRYSPAWRRKSRGASRPHPVGTAEVGYAGVGADARAREGDDVVALDDPPSDRPDVLVDAIHYGFPAFQPEAPDADVRKQSSSGSPTSENAHLLQR